MKRFNLGLIVIMLFGCSLALAADKVIVSGYVFIQTKAVTAGAKTQNILITIGSPLSEVPTDSSNVTSGGVNTVTPVVTGTWEWEDKGAHDGT